MIGFIIFLAVHSTLTYKLCRFVCEEKTPSGREVILFEDKPLRNTIAKQYYTYYEVATGTIRYDIMKYLFGIGRNSCVDGVFGNLFPVRIKKPPRPNGPFGNSVAILNSIVSNNHYA